MEAGAWASVKIMLCLANVSMFGVFRVLAMALVFGINRTPKYALVSPIPMSSAMKIMTFGFLGCAETVPSQSVKRRNPCRKRSANAVKVLVLGVMD